VVLQLADLSAASISSAIQQRGLQEQTVCKLQMVACQDSWYRACVELIVPSLLHIGAVGTLGIARYMAAAAFWFGKLDGLLDARISAVDYGEPGPSGSAMLDFPCNASAAVFGWCWNFGLEAFDSLS
jgi:hypothetical protein